jgi:KDO2-lipid IV(A) lauroyltransferase
MKYLNLMVYGVIKSFLLLGKIVPMQVTFFFMRLLARAVYPFLGKRREIMLWNLEHALGDETTEEERKRIAFRSIENLFVAMGELLHLEKITNNFNKHFTWEGKEIVDRYIAEGKGFFVFGGHYGGWTLPSVAPALFPELPAVNMVARPLRNPYMDSILHYLAGKFNGKVVTTRGTGQEIVDAINNGELVGLYMDQESRRGQGIFIKFFGRDASSHVVPGYLAWKHNIPLVPFWIPRTRSGHFHVIFRGPLQYELTDDTEENNRRVTQAIADEVERTIRERPEQWLWAHSRWRRRPDGTVHPLFERKKRSRSKSRKAGHYLSSVDQSKQAEKQEGPEKGPE